MVAVVLVVVFAVLVVSLDSLIVDEIVFVAGVVVAIALVGVIGDVLFVKVEVFTGFPFFIAVVVVAVLVIFVVFD